MKEGSLYVHQEHGVGIVQFYHPESNSLNSDLLRRMAGAFEELGKDEQVKVIVLKSEKDRAFCAGASLSELSALQDKKEATEYFKGFGKVIASMINCPKPIIGRIQGKAVGGAVGLIAACDYAMGTEYSAVRLSELSIGIGPYVVEPVISYKIGKSAASQMSWNPKSWFSAYWAKEKGLLAKVLENTADLDSETDALARQWAGYPTAALEDLKAIFWEDIRREYAERILHERAAISGKLVLSDYTKGILEKFKK